MAGDGANPLLGLPPLKSTPEQLILAAELGDVAAARTLLLETSCPIDPRDSSNRTPLHISAEAGYEDFASLLIDAGANLEVTSSTRLTPLRIAVDSRRVGVILALVAAGADTEARDDEGATPLHSAAAGWRTNSSTAHDGDVDPVLLALLNGGADLEARDFVGQTPLSWAVCMGNVHAARSLLLAGADPNTRDNRGRSPLHTAARKPEDDSSAALLAVALLSAGANPSPWSPSPFPSTSAPSTYSTSSFGQNFHSSATLSVCRTTPLHSAAREGNASVLRELLLAGADHSLREDESGMGLTPLHLATGPVEGSGVCVRTLLEAGADPESLSLGLPGPGVGEGMTALQLACLNASADAVEELLNWGAQLRGNLCAGLSREWSGWSDDKKHMQLTGVKAPRGWPGQEQVSSATPSLGLRQEQGERQVCWQDLGSGRLECAPSGEGLERGLLGLVGLVGLAVPEARRDKKGEERVFKALIEVGADRAWKRRGWLVLLHDKYIRSEMCGRTAPLGVGIQGLGGDRGEKRDRSVMPWMCFFGGDKGRVDQGLQGCHLKGRGSEWDRVVAESGGGVRDGQGRILTNAFTGEAPESGGRRGLNGEEHLRPCGSRRGSINEMGIEQGTGEMLVGEHEILSCDADEESICSCPRCKRTGAVEMGGVPIIGQACSEVCSPSSLQGCNSGVGVIKCCKCELGLGTGKTPRGAGGGCKHRGLHDHENTGARLRGVDEDGRGTCSPTPWYDAHGSGANSMEGNGVGSLVGVVGKLLNLQGDHSLFQKVVLYL